MVAVGRELEGKRLERWGSLISLREHWRGGHI